jgi:hypothetical protein
MLNDRMEEGSFEFKVSLASLPQLAGRVAQRPCVPGDGYRGQRGDEGAEWVKEPDEAIQENANQQNSGNDEEHARNLAENRREPPPNPSHFVPVASVAANASKAPSVMAMRIMPN